MTQIIPQDSLFLKLPVGSDLSPTMTIIHAYAYERADGPQRGPRILNLRLWSNLMGRSWLQAMAGLTEWSPAFRSKTKAALNEAGLCQHAPGGLMFRMRSWHKAPWSILLHPNLTACQKVRWAHYCASANNETGCVPEWCGPGHSGPASRSHQNHAQAFVKMGLAVEREGHYSLVPLATIGSLSPLALHGSVYACRDGWREYDDIFNRVEMLAARDALGRKWAAPFRDLSKRRSALGSLEPDVAAMEERVISEQETTAWKRYNAELTQIALKSRRRLDLITLGFYPGLMCGQGMCQLDDCPELQSLPDPDGILSNPMRFDLARAGQRAIEKDLGVFFY